MKIIAKCFAAWASVALFCALESEAKQPPHVLLVLADDFGWRNAGFRGDSESEEVQTPNMNKLASEGLVLDRFYAYKICSPSRSVLQSGRLAVHVNVVNTAPEVFNPNDIVSGFAGIPRNMTGVATRLKEAGYKTHMVGKWDVGMATYEHTPLGRGYDTALYYFHHANDYYTYGLPFQSTGEINICLNRFTDLSDNNKPGKQYVTKPARYEEEWFMERSLDVIRNHDASEPLFLFHSFHIVHTPLEVPDEYLSKFDFIDHKGRRKYAAMVYFMDEVIGELVSAFKAKGMWDNTLMIFSSDNGGPLYKPASANNYPLKGGKYSDWEGGIRVNAFASGGWIPQERRGQRVHDYIHIADIYTTLLALAGLDAHDVAAERAGLPPVDGLDQSAVLLGTKKNVRTEIHVSELALIQGEFKLVMGSQPFSGWTGPTYPNTTGEEPTFYPKGWISDECKDGCLFNIMEDPTEHVDLASHNVTLLNSMKARLEELNKSNFNPDRGEPNIRACIAALMAGGFYTSFLRPKDLEQPHLVPTREEEQLFQRMIQQEQVQVV